MSPDRHQRDREGCHDPEGWLHAAGVRRGYSGIVPFAPECPTFNDWRRMSGYEREELLKGLVVYRPTVSTGVTCAVVCTYGCDDGRIALTRCAIIDAGLDGRCRPRRTCRTPPAAARSARNALAAGLRPVSTADPGAFPRSRTTLPAGIRPCGDASPPRSVPGIRPCLPHLCLV